MENTIIDVEFSENTEMNENKDKKGKKVKGCSLKIKKPKLSKKKVAKVGMVSTLALTTLSGFVSGKYAKKVHLASGFALAGFCIWHASLYKKSKKCCKKVSVECKEKHSTEA